MSVSRVCVAEVTIRLDLFVAQLGHEPDVRACADVCATHGGSNLTLTEAQVPPGGEIRAHWQADEKDRLLFSLHLAAPSPACLSDEKLMADHHRDRSR